MKIRAVAATTFTDHENGWSYTETALRELAESAQYLPVIFRKKQIGRVESGQYQEGKILIQAEVSQLPEFNSGPLFLVPGGLTDFETDGKLLSRCLAHRYVITDNPSDESLTELEIAVS